MPAYSTIVNNRKFDVWASLWSGKESVRVDGEAVSEKHAALASIQEYWADYDALVSLILGLPVIFWLKRRVRQARGK